MTDKTKEEVEAIKKEEEYRKEVLKELDNLEAFTLGRLGGIWKTGRLETWKLDKRYQ